jgi:putative transposase
MRLDNLWIKHVKTVDGVRRVPISGTSLTGNVLGGEFESSLERDLLLLVAFDRRTDWYQTQPVKIEYVDSQGKARTYTPDVLIHFANQRGTPHRKPLLCEVKYRSELRDKWGEIRPKIKAARAYAMKKGWDFAIFDERRIRTTRLKNIQFLWSYRFSNTWPEESSAINRHMLSAPPARICDVLKTLFEDPESRSRGLWCVWTMLAQGSLYCDLTAPLSTESVISHFWGDVSREASAMSWRCHRAIEARAERESIVEDVRAAMLQSLRGSQEGVFVDAGRVDPLVIDERKRTKALAEQTEIEDFLRLEPAKQTKDEARRTAKRLGISVATFYRKMAKVRSTGSISTLLRKERADKGRSRLAEEQEALIAECITSRYLNENRPSLASVAREVEKLAFQRGVKAPSPSAVIARIRAVDGYLSTLHRYGKKAAKERYSSNLGSIPNAEFPLAIVQIDHTPVDVIVVSEEERTPIQRPYLSVVIDVESRVCLGFYLSLEAPSTLSTGLALVHAILPKDDYLASIGLPNVDWPCHGKPRTVHTDNGADFRSDDFKWALATHGILGDLRPKGSPEYGGTVESGFRTFMREVHEEIPGTTFSSVADKFEYDSEGKAVMTLAALERWFVIYLADYYNQRGHSSLDGHPPIHAWRQGFSVGTSGAPARGTPPPLAAPDMLKLDFLPSFRRTIQDYGIQNWNINWWSEALRPLIRQKDPKKPSAHREYVVRYDPRDLSVVWLYLEDKRMYLQVPIADIRQAGFSLWELRSAKKALQAQGRAATNKALIFKAIDAMRELVAEEAKLTKAAARQRERAKAWNKAAAHIPRTKPDVMPAAPAMTLEDDELITPIEGIREL